MRRAIAAWCALAILILAVRPTPAAAQGEGFLSSTAFSLTGGLLIPQGIELDPGTHLGLSALYETRFGISVGAEGTMSHSNDPLQIRITSLSLHARISPEPEYYAAYLLVGAGVYRVDYNPGPGEVAPEARVRPGANFGFGVEFFTWGNVSLGGSAVYHGLIINRGDKVAFVSAAATLTWRPGQF
jgi:hypothetical protein